MRGDGRIFKRGATWWMSFYVDGHEQRESTKTKDEEKARKTLRAKLKEVHAHELDPTRPFLTRRHRKRTIADLLNELKSDFEIRGIASKQNLSNIKRTRADFGMVRATVLSPE